MGTTIASSSNSNVSNRNVALAPSDSAVMTTAQVTYHTDPARPAAIRTLWTGATYSALNVPAGENYSDYVISGGSLVKKINLPTLENMKFWFRRYHDYLASLSARLEGEEAKLWSWDFLKKAHDWVAWLHHGTNVIGTRRTTALATITIAQRIGFCQQAMLGPADIRSITTVEGRIHKIYEILSASAHTAPIAPVAYVDPRGTPAAVGLNSAVTLSATLGISAITDFTGDHAVDVNGSWINNLTG